VKGNEIRIKKIARPYPPQRTINKGPRLDASIKKKKGKTF